MYSFLLARAIRRSASPSVVTISMLLAGGACLVAPVSYGQTVEVASERYYRIPAGSLASALNKFAVLSGHYFAGNSQLLDGKKTQGLEGEYRLSDALDLLLQGTGLSYQVEDSGSIILIDPSKVKISQNEVLMSPLMIRDSKGSNRIGSQIMGAEEIEDMPTDGGNLTDLLQSNPAVNFSRSSSQSANSASMRPDEISIHGQSYYQNAFLIDGIDSSNDFDPGSSGDGDSYSNPINPSNLSTLSGSSPQSYYVDVDAIDQVQVYDSNIPVEYGGFTGGVIDARLKRYDGEDSLSVKYGLEKDAWEKFHVDQKVDDGFNYGDGYDGSYTPDYKKQNFSITAFQGFSENVGGTLTASHKTSHFKQHYTNTSTQEEVGMYYDDVIDNVMGRIDVKTNERSDLGFSFKYSNRYYDGLTSTTYNSPFVQSHEAFGFGSDLDYRFDDSRLTIQAGFDRSSDDLDSESSTYALHRKSNLYASNYYEGGYGDVTQQQNTYSLNTKWVHDAFALAGMKHTFTLGSNLKHVNAFYEVNGDITGYTYTCASPCSSASDEYISVENTIAANKLEKSYSSYALFLQDEVAIGDWTTTLGVRAENETLLDNINIAPRASVDWNVFGDESTHLLAGASRYYGRSFLKYAINDTLRSWRVQNRYDSSGNLTSQTTYADRSLQDYDLKTPYSDELMLGWQQAIGRVTSTLKLVNRESRDGVHRARDEDGNYYYNNEGRSSTNSVTWSLDQRRPFILLGTATKLAFAIGWQESKSNSQSDAAYDEILDEDPIYYKGRLVDYSELPSWDYNIPFSIKLSSSTHIPSWHVSWSNFVNVKSGGTIAQNSGEDYEDSEGNEYDIYEDKKFDRLITVDSKIRYTPPLFSHYEGYLEFQVTNLFDKVISVTSSTSSTATQTFTAGRKVSIEVGMKF